MTHKFNLRILGTLSSVAFACTLFFMGSGSVFAANGSGTDIVSPTSSIISTSAGTFVFTFTAAETMNSGGITIAVPSGWTVPQGVSGVAGYTTVSTTGTVGKVLDSCDSVTGWGHSTSNPHACSGGLSLDATTQHEGTGAVKCVNSSDSTHGVWYKNIAEQDWSSYKTVSLWIKSSAAFNNGDLSFDYAGDTNLQGPIESLSLGNAIPANAWTNVIFSFAAATSTRTNVVSYGFEIKNSSNLKNATVEADDILVGASTSIVPTFSGSTIIIRALSLTAGQTITVTYGAGGGTSGVTTPSTAGNYTFTTQSRTSDAGTLTNIASSPVVAVGGPAPTLTSISPTSTTAGSSGFTLTLMGSNFTASSSVRWNGSTRATTFISSSTLQATILTSDLTTPTTTAVTVTNPAPGGGTSAAQTFTINKAVTSITATSSAASSIYGSTVTFTATVTSTASGIPTGSVTFKDGATTLGTGTLNGGSPDIATFSTSTLSVSGSPHSITVVYGGDSNFNGSTSGVLSQIVTAKALTVSGITANGKTYDASTTATLNVGSAALVGVVAGDAVTLNTGSAVGTFATSSVGTNIAVVISGLTISGAQASNYTLTQPTTSANITAKSLTVTGITASSKIYDRTTTATLNTGSATLVGVIAGDTVALNTVGVVGTFATSSVGSGISVTISGLTISGAQSSDYTLAQPTASANITTKSLTVSGITANSKTYDASTTAALSTGSASLIGVVPGDTVTLNAVSATGVFATSSVGSGIAVTVSGLTISGAQAANYTLTQPATSANITTKSLTVTGITASSKIYDRTTTATLNAGSATLVGVITGDTVSLNTIGAAGVFATSLVGAGISVAVSGLSLSGAQSSNYTLTQPTTSANITTKPLTVSGVTANNRTYDASTTATLNTGSASLVGVVSGDVVTLNTGSAVGTFATSSVGTGISVAVSGLSISGSSSGNYSLTQPTASANITAKSLTVSGITANSKTYDASTTATLNTGSAALIGIAPGDTVILGAGSAIGTFATSSVETNIAVQISGLTLSGAQAGSYTLTQPTSSANITVKSLTVTGITANNKTYDGTTAATLNTSGASLVGVIAGDSVTLNTSGAIGTFATSSVGTNIAVTISGLTLIGAQASNYSLTQPATTANITTNTLTVTGITANNKVYDGTNAATLNVGGAALVGTPSGVTLNTTGATGTFATSSVGTNIPVQISGLTLSGAQAGSYTLTQPTSSANITTKSLLVTGITAQDKTYDGTTAATLSTSSASLVGVVAGDIVTLNTTGATGVFATSSVGSGIAVTISGLTISGVDAANYTLTQPATTASITSLSFSITSISPTSTTAGSAGFTLTVNGTNFVSSSVVNFNGVAASTSFVSSGQLTAFIASSSVATAGSYPVIVTNSGPGGGTSNSESFNVAAIVANPAPILTAIAPTSTIAGLTSLTLTVTGSNFSSNSTVQWNGAPLATTFVSSSTLTAVVTSIDLTSASTSSITVFTPAPGGGTSGSVVFTVNAPSTNSAAIKFIFANVTASAIAGNDVTFNIEAVNASNTIDTSFEQGVTLTVGGSGTGGGLVTIVNGVGTSTVSDNTAQAVAIALEDSQSTGLDVSAATSITFLPGPLARFVLNHPGNMNVGTRLAYTLGREDQFGNPVTASTTVAYLYTNSSSSNAAFFNAATGGSPITSATVSSGSTSTVFWYYDDSSGSRTVTASDNASAPDGATGIIDASDTFTIAPGAVKFIFANVPSGLTAGGSATVNVYAVDSLGVIYPSFAGSVAVTTSGSATGAGLVTLVNGVGTVTIADQVAETVVIGLSDTQNTGLGVGATAQLVFSPVQTVTPPPTTTPASGGSSGGPAIVEVPLGIQPGVTLTLAGRAYPGAMVSVIRKDLGLQSVPVTQAIPTAADGSFLIELNNITRLTGQTYLLSFVDKNGLIAQTKAYNIPAQDKIVYGDILAAPTLGFQNSSVVAKGAPLVVTGYATPKATVNLFVDGNPAGVIVVNDPSGKYSYTLATDNLSSGRHAVWATQQYGQNTTEVSGYENPLATDEIFVDDATIGTLFTKGASGAYIFAPMSTSTVHAGPVIFPVGVSPVYTKQAESDFSNQQSLTISPLKNPKLDLNGDGVVDLKDASIFLTYLKNLNASLTNFNIVDPTVIRVLDLNGDGVVDIADLKVLTSAILSQ